MPLGPYGSLEELQRLAYQQPYRVRTPRLNPSTEGPLGYETEDVIQPGWQKNAALEALRRVQQTDEGTEDAERARIEGVRDAQSKSALAGFNTPQDAALYGRRMEEAKIQQPITQQNIIAQTQRDVTRMQGENTLANTRLQQEGALNLQDRYNELMKTLQGPGNPNPINRFTLPGQRGGGSIGFDTNPQRPNAVPPQLAEAVRRTKTDLQANRNPTTETAYNMAAANAINNALQQGIISGPTARLATEIAKDASLRDLPWEQLQGYLEPEAGAQMDPKELEELYQALLILRGM